jgi:RNA polymerase sigma-70 factor (ECF subfamily)
MVPATMKWLRSERVLLPMRRRARKAEGQRPAPAIDIETVYNKYHRRVLLWCLRVVRNKEDAEDLTQDAFIHVMRKIHTYRGEAHFSTWLYRVVMNTVFMRLRRKHLPQTPLDEILEANEGAINPSREVRIMNETLGALIARVDIVRALEQMPRGFSATFVLHDRENYSHSEIAEILGWTVGTSKSQLHKARRRLRVLLTENGTSIGSVAACPQAGA